MNNQALDILNEVFFEDIEKKIKQTLKKAKESIKICVAWINIKNFSSIFNGLLDKGVSIEIIYNSDSLNAKNIEYLDKRIRVYPFTNWINRALMHNKFCIVDDEIIITGSYNWSLSARNHFENILIIYNDFQLTKSFMHEFEDLKFYLEFWGEVVPSARSPKFYNILILGPESGMYYESDVDNWRIEFKKPYEKIQPTFLGSVTYHHLRSYLGLNNDDYDDNYYHSDIYTKNNMIEDFKQERRLIEDFKTFSGNNGEDIAHAIGIISISNTNEHLEWDEEPNYVINILWRNIYYRKVIPSILDEEDFDIEPIIRKHI